MKRIINLLGIISLALMLPLTTLSAQKCSSGGWGQNNQYSRLFDPTTIVSLKATVNKVERIIPENGMAYGVHLLVTTENKENISVHLGPLWYLDNQDFAIEIGDTVLITGSKIEYQNAPAIIAADVEKGEMVLHLRDKDGFPAWNGWRKKGKNQCCNSTRGS